MDTPVRAVFDMGSNALKLTICRFHPDRIETLLDEERVTRLGEGVARDGRIGEAATGRALEALDALLTRAEAHDPTSLDLLGTEALRRAEDRDAFIRRIHQRTGLRTRLLDAAEEASLAFAAVRTEFPEGPLTVIDLGGGSADISWGGTMLPSGSWSLPLGARVLHRAVPLSDPPTLSELDALRARAREALADADAPPKGEVVLSRGGVSTSLLAAAQALFGSPPGPVERSFSPEGLDLLILKLGRMTEAQRRDIHPALHDRADVILHAAIALRELFGALGVDTAFASRHGIGHGLLEVERTGAMVDRDAPTTTLPEANFPPLNRPGRRGEVLFALRRRDGAFWLQRKEHYAPGVFRLPGGGIDPGERSREAVLRELAEETGLPDPRPVPYGRIHYRTEDAALGFSSDLYLVECGDRVPHATDPDERVEAWHAAPPGELAVWSARLHGIEGELHSWGVFRAAALDYLGGLIGRGALPQPPA